VEVVDGILRLFDFHIEHATREFRGRSPLSVVEVIKVEVTTPHVQDSPIDAEQGSKRLLCRV